MCKFRRGIATLGVIVIATIIIGTTAVIVPSVDKLFFDGEIITNYIEGKDTPSK